MLTISKLIHKEIINTNLVININIKNNIEEGQPLFKGKK